MGAQMSREFLPPFPKSCLADIETHPLFAHGLHNHVHVGMRLIGVKHHRVSVLKLELLPREVEVAAGKSPLAQIALNVSFSSQASFTQAFRRATGMTPGQYRMTRR
jgi:AraC-like DNA-binding protein